MSEITFDRVVDGWQMTDGELVILALHPHVDRGAVKAALSVRRDGTILWTETVNLTSARARARFTHAVKKRDADVIESSLIALEDVCRHRVLQNDNDVHPSDFSETPPAISWAEMEGVVRKWLLLTDPHVLRVMLGVIVAHGWGGDPVWLLLVAPPGGVKTELLAATFSRPSIYPISELTARTFASGLDTGKGDPSLLARLDEEVLVLKDFTTLLESSHDERKAVLAQLREIYDGRFDKVWGNGKELHWRGRLGFLAGVTPIIDRHQAVLSVLGERFIQLRIQQPNRLEVAQAALDTVGREIEMREELSRAVAGCLAGFNDLPTPQVPRRVQTKVAQLADFTTRARSGVLRDGYRRELDYAPEPEAPTRFARQLLSLARGVAGTRRAAEVGEADEAVIQRVALDCIPSQRRIVLCALVQGEADEELSTSQVAGKSRYSTQTNRRALEDLQALGLVTMTKTGAGRSDRWSLREEWRETFSEMSQGGAYNAMEGAVEIEEGVLGA